MSCKRVATHGLVLAAVARVRLEIRETEGSTIFDVKLEDEGTGGGQPSTSSRRSIWPAKKRDLKDLKIERLKALRAIGCSFECDS
ncbi:hypothetical protein BCR35DRAFT_310564 [Leucosporidium creatinivorum]|uniref:Uncharacterized protein n=1 Tax=Leucosporidium creatinivorum TaxID=106004 RepID=A0A1Y2D0N4_9BASI|nr:hypothetical protein BCR35DRAFT_310564 [Leucosporidium creatinivorum]